MLAGKTIILGVSGSIAAYKSAALASSLKKAETDVHVIMTKNACQFISGITFESLTGNKCLVDTFDRNFEFSIEHVSLAKMADCMVVAPASADIIGKLAHGIADDMLTTTAMACSCTKIIAPAMNTHMYENPVLKDNLLLLEKYGWHIAKPEAGRLACGDVGAGKMQEPLKLMEYIEYLVGYEKDLAGKNVLITAGPTREALDPVRFLTNHSTGRMGTELAKAAASRGANVTLVMGKTDIEPPQYLHTINVLSAGDMFDAVKELYKSQDILIMAAAVADYRPKVISDRKIKKQDEVLELSLERTGDILKFIGKNKRPEQFLCGFSMETENLLENSRKKMLEKHADMMACNSLNTKGAGFAVDTNVLTLITADREEELPLMSKKEAAHKILDRCTF